MDHPPSGDFPQQPSYQPGAAQPGPHGGLQPPINPHHAASPVPAPKNNTWTWLLGIGIGVVVLCLGSLGACAAIGIGMTAKFSSDVDEAMDELAAKKGDVKVTSCETKPDDLLSGVDVGYLITNSGDDVRSYVITFAVNDRDGDRLGYTMESHRDVAAGQTATGTARVLLDTIPSGELGCVVTDAF